MVANCDLSISSEELQRNIDFLKVISDANRLKILCLLKWGEMQVNDIVESLGIAQNLTSHHLKSLRESDLVATRKEGLQVYYALNKDYICQNIEFINSVFKW